MATARQVYEMLENQSLWQTALHCHGVFRAAGIPHALVGGVAVCLHGYRRNTVDLDLVIRKEDVPAVRARLEAEGCTWRQEEADFLAPGGIPIQFLLAGERAGKGSEVAFPDPEDPRNVVEIEGLPVLTLARLIETKLASGEGNPRRTHKDFADVVELVLHHDLDGSFARHLHKALRPTFRKLVGAARGEE